MRKRYLGPWIGAALILAGLAAGCVNLGTGTERLPRFFVLAAMASDAERVSFTRPESLTIGVGPLTFPDYLDRPQLVTRAGASEINLAPFANWAEPLKANVVRVMVENVSTITGTGAVYRFPWRVGHAPQFQLQMEIDRFDAAPREDAVLVVSWEWLDQDAQPLTPRMRSVLHQAVQGDSDEAIVAAMSRLLHDFSRLATARLAAILS